MTQELKSRLHAAIGRAISRQQGSFSGADIAAAVKRLDADLWDEAREVLATEKLIAIATSTMRGPLQQINSSQLALAGFEDIPKYIRAGKRWIEIRDANSQELQEFADWYRTRLDKAAERVKRDRRIVADIERLARIVKRYERQAPGITLGTVLEMREVKQELAQLRA